MKQRTLTNDRNEVGPDMKEYSNIFPSPPKLCTECEEKQYDFLQFRRDNEDNMTREELNNALATKFKVVFIFAKFALTFLVL